jgi:hypothetical protein
MTFTYTDDCPATVASAIRLSEALEVVRRGRAFLACLDRHGIEAHPDTTRAFGRFLEGLYGAGFVMSDFDGLLFDRGPMLLIYEPGLADALGRAANLTTIRMFTHTLARAHRSDCGDGYPCFDRAYRSGGLRALIERLEQHCGTAQEMHLPQLPAD